MKGMNLRVGNKLVEGGRVFRVFKIGKKKFNGKTDRVIHYRPLFNKNINDFVCSVPETSLSEMNIRRPLSRKELKEILGSLSKKAGGLRINNDVEAKEVLKSNSAERVSKLIKTYWKKKDNVDEVFTKNKKDILEGGIEKLAEEVALSYRISPESAKEKILQQLGG